MGVHELWSIVGPTARPVRLEGLRGKRLAIDASIWIYQFLKAVRDSEGNPMKNSHIVGFFRRICKLLYFGIKPVFVFDGGVPALKKRTIQARKQRREDQRESMEKTAHRLLAKKLQHIAEVTEQGGTVKKKKADDSSKPFENYYEDSSLFVKDDDNVHPTPSNRPVVKHSESESKMFRRQDDYDLPQMDRFKIEKNDERMVTGYEYDRLTNAVQEDLNDIDWDNIDPKSAEFNKLPLSTQYVILSHLRLRSRLRMGYTKDQLQALFPDSMEFSKFQIRMVQKRNYFTQRLMNASGMDKGTKSVTHHRIAGEKNREYTLKRTNGGYVMSITKENEKEGKDVSNPINVDEEDGKLRNEGEITISDESSDDIDDDMDDSGEVEILSGTDDGAEEVISIDDETSDNNDEASDDNDEASDDDDTSIVWEDVTKEPTSSPIKLTKAGIPMPPTSNIQPADSNSQKATAAFMDPSVHQETSSFADEDSITIEKKDPIMEKIKSLYSYAERNNKNGDTMTVPAIIQQDQKDEKATEDKKLPSEDEQLREMEEQELRAAIESSKKDYLAMMDKENGAVTTVDDSNQPPIILSTDSLKKTMKLPNFSFGNSLLSTKNVLPKKKKGTLNRIDAKESAKEPTEEPAEEPAKEPISPQKVPIKKSQPIPAWFEEKSSAKDRFTADIGVERKEPSTQTADEKAGLHKFVEVEDLLSESEDEKPEVVVLSDEEEPIKNEKEKKIENEAVDHKIVDHETVETVDTVPEVNVDRQEDKKDTDKVENPVKAKDSGLDYEFSDEEEEQLHENMKKETEAYGKFVSDVSGEQGMNPTKWTMTEETKLQEKLKKQKRDADEVSTSMILDVQDMLSRFGIPYITAPMEAEAQCAELYGLQLVDGIVTDDSDCFLFGGTKIYKNMFNEKSYVECYQLEDIERDMGLTRMQLIEFAMMLGSDYTPGLKGIGKVTATEILSEFKDLETFKNWWIDYQNGIIDKKTDNKMRRKLRKQLNRAGLYLGNDFPDQQIYDAYLHPNVDHDKTAFRWGHPNLDKLRTFLMYNVRWSREKIDQILLPIIKDLNKPQQTIEEFFPVELVRKRREIMMGKRMRDATDKLKSAYDKRKRQKT